MSAVVQGKREIDLIPKETPELMKKIMELCWNQLPNKRPIIEEVLKLLGVIDSDNYISHLNPPIPSGYPKLENQKDNLNNNNNNNINQQQQTNPQQVTNEKSNSNWQPTRERPSNMETIKNDGKQRNKPNQITINQFQATSDLDSSNWGGGITVNQVRTPTTSNNQIIKNDGKQEIERNKTN